MATHSSILAWKIPLTEESAGLQSMGCKGSDMTNYLREYDYLREYICRILTESIEFFKLKLSYN